MKARIIFFGNTRFSVIDARSLHERFGLMAIVTISDKVVGRKKTLTPSPTKSFALKQNIPIIEADKLTADKIEEIKHYEPDFIIVADYGLILPKSLLEIPKYASLNVHHSLLPKYRGPSPAPFAILAGEKVSGVTVIRMNEQVDAGEILAQKEYRLKPNETTESLLTKLNTLGGEIIIPVINAYLQGNVKEIAQDNTQATFTTYMEKNDGYIDHINPPTPTQIDRMIRAYFPWPGVWTEVQNAEGKKQRVKLLPQNQLQMEGKNAVSRKDFFNGYPELKEQLEPLLLQ